MREAISSSETSGYISDSHGVITQKTALFQPKLSVDYNFCSPAGSSVHGINIFK
jgi:hypothetical protein